MRDCRVVRQQLGVRLCAFRFGRRIAAAVGRESEHNDVGRRKSRCLRLPTIPKRCAVLHLPSPAHVDTDGTARLLQGCSVGTRPDSDQRRRYYRPDGHGRPGVAYKAQYPMRRCFAYPAPTFLHGAGTAHQRRVGVPNQAVSRQCGSQRDDSGQSVPPCLFPVHDNRRAARRAGHTLHDDVEVFSVRRENRNRLQDRTRSTPSRDGGRRLRWVSREGLWIGRAVGRNEPHDHRRGAWRCAARWDCCIVGIRCCHDRRIRDRSPGESGNGPARR